MKDKISSLLHQIPWISIWTQPRKTIRKILDEDPERNVIGILSIVICVKLWGILLGFMVFTNIYPLINPGITTELISQKTIPRLILSLIIKPIALLIGIYIQASLLTAMGKLPIFNGRGSIKQLITAVVYPKIIEVETSLLISIVILSMIVFFQVGGNHIIIIFMGLILALLYLVQGLASFIVQIITVSEAHKVSNMSSIFITVIVAVTWLLISIFLNAVFGV